MRKNTSIYIAGLSGFLALMAVLWLIFYLEGFPLKPQQKRAMEQIVKFNEISRTHKLVPLNHSLEDENWTLPEYHLQKQTLSSNITLYEELQKSKTKATILLFWGTWLDELAISQLKQLEEIYQKYSPKGLTVFAIALETDFDAFRNRMNQLSAEIQPTYPVLLALDLSLQKQYQLTSMPVFFLIDERGKIRFRYVGSDSLQFKVAENVLDQLMLEQSKP